MLDSVSREVMDFRMARLLREQDKISLERNLPYLDKVYRVLVDSPAKRGENVYLAHTSTAKVVHFKSDACRVGEFVDLKIEKVGAYEMFGTEVN